MMVTQRLLVFFIVFCFIMQTSDRVGSAPVQQKLCPPGCLCEEKEVQFVYVNCYYKNMRIFPATFPDNVETLEFSGNPIGALSASDLIHNALKSLKDLSLENCELTELNDGVFSNLRNLLQLNLANNNLTYVSPDLFVGLFKFRYLNLTGNPLLNINKTKKEFEKKLLQEVHIEFRVDKPAPILNHTTAIMPSPGSNNPSTTSSSSNDSGPPQGSSTSSTSGGVDAPVDKDAHANTEMSNGSDNHADPTLNSGIDESSTTSSEEGTVATREPFLPLSLVYTIGTGIIGIAVIVGFIFRRYIIYCFHRVIGQLGGAQILIRNDRHIDSQADIYAPPNERKPLVGGVVLGETPQQEHRTSQ